MTNTSGREPFASPDERDTNDLGFGSRVAEQSGDRLLNRDGSFNVTRRGVGYFQSMSLYHSLLTMSWLRFNLMISGAYLLFNLLFAAGYVMSGADALKGLGGVTLPERFTEALFFSVQTSTTIGYGHIEPSGIVANVLVGVEAMLALLGFATAAGFVFARFSRPHAKVLFSKRAIVAPYRGIMALEFRIVNVRSSQLIQVQAKVILSRLEGGPNGKTRKFHDLSLERKSVVLFPLSWTIVHPIDERSPLAGVTEESFRESDPEILVLLTAIEETYSQTVHSRTSYKAHEVVWGAKFGEMFNRSPDGILSVDLNRIHTIESTGDINPASS